MAILGERQTQVSARAIYDKAINKSMAVYLALDVVDAKNLKFTANVQFTDGEGDMQQFTIADDTAKPRIFADVDSAIKWVNGTFYDLSVGINIVINDLPVTPEPLPRDAKAEAVRQLAYWNKQVENVAKPLAQLNVIKTDQEQLGWNASNANPTLKERYAETMRRIAQVNAHKNLYTAVANRWKTVVNT